MSRTEKAKLNMSVASLVFIFFLLDYNVDYDGIENLKIDVLI